MTPVTGRHSMIDSPEPVRRVAPPSAIITSSMPHRVNSHSDTSCGVAFREREPDDRHRRRARPPWSSRGGGHEGIPVRSLSATPSGHLAVGGTGIRPAAAHVDAHFDNGRPVPYCKRYGSGSSCRVGHGEMLPRRILEYREHEVAERTAAACLDREGHPHHGPAVRPRRESARSLLKAALLLCGLVRGRRAAAGPARTRTTPLLQGGLLQRGLEGRLVFLAVIGTHGLRRRPAAPGGGLRRRLRLRPWPGAPLLTTLATLAGCLADLLWARAIGRDWVRRRVLHGRHGAAGRLHRRKPLQRHPDPAPAPGRQQPDGQPVLRLSSACVIVAVPGGHPAR